MMLAIAILSSSPSNQDYQSLHTDALRLTVVDIAMQWEILDKRELSYTLKKKENFQSDIELLQQRYQSLHDAPPFDDCQRFPDRDFLNNWLIFNRQYREYINNSLQSDPSWRETVLKETDELYKFWDTIRDAKTEYYYLSVRRNAMKEARQLIGFDNYYSGKFPPVVPFWRYRWID